MARTSLKLRRAALGDLPEPRSTEEQLDGLARELERVREQLKASEQETVRLAEELTEERTRRKAAEARASSKAVPGGR